MDLYDDDLTGDGHWAFGTGFADPLAGIDAPPASPELAAYCLALGDDALVMSHRLQEWCTRAPELEDEVAIANVALDLLGQARLLLARTGRGEDDLAFGRDAAEFRSVRLAEAANGDFAHLVVRLLLFATWRLAILGGLRDHPDPVLAAIAAKGVKEVAYHRDYAAGWAIRLGDGTAESHRRMRAALEALWPLVPDLHADHPGARAEFETVVADVLARATLDAPATTGRAAPRGEHLPELADAVAEMQSVARALPGATW
ncbi:1,2-phenylacetyl-CoA epoxidase subunit PaaC [Actinomadura parmotrematis]|uniref:Phenylacetate-CoA oxygenase subunit PaaC n=1 Tax=Actinomadura parmotrematis TaxID=2864039 RepID=A0ABS7G1C6_9ACTN|nr:1,2-phenylacetyl-CoA epoxidase subunit PaaC [Actinomadura parmotrematis]MBW8486482.1 phenylacetate-CoA oxygenase subunit PaaC [Actinomadura parmotrematis]